MNNPSTKPKPYHIPRNYFEPAIYALTLYRKKNIGFNQAVDIAHASRDARNVATGISPRGSLALLRACRAYAMVKGRDYVVPEDIKAIAVPVLAHRIVINGSVSTISEQKKIIENILNLTPLTTEDWKK